MKKIILLICISIFLLTPLITLAQEFTDEGRKLIVFFSPSCRRCIEIKNGLMPQVEKEFKGKINIEYRDITNLDNYKLMLGLREKHGPKMGLALPVFYFEGYFFNAEGPIEENLRWLMVRALTMPERKPELALLDLAARFKSFKPFTIISAGLIDGINPCAFTVIVFFISFLALQGYRKRQLIIIGLAFIFSVFLTYLFVGLGLFSFLYRLKGFWRIIKIFDFSVGILSIIFGLFCLYDFYKFRKTKDTEGLVLQLPRAIKNQIHKVIGLHYRRSKSEQSKNQISRVGVFRLSLSALICGFLLSVLEAICTGQVYLPTIVFVLKTTHLKLQALVYLLLYNLMFIIPLVIIFLFGLLGVTSEQFSKFLKQHLLSIKLIMAVLFFSLGIFLLYQY